MAAGVLGAMDQQAPARFEDNPPREGKVTPGSAAAENLNADADDGHRFGLSWLLYKFLGHPALAGPNRLPALLRLGRATAVAAPRLIPCSAQSSSS
ncbi:hypothetical protein VTH82DRAFT_5114 [Thermothelomyces myriococcoides]